MFLCVQRNIRRFNEWGDLTRSNFEVGSRNLRELFKITFSSRKNDNVFASAKSENFRKILLGKLCGGKRFLYFETHKFGILFSECAKRKAYQGCNILF